MPPKSKGKQISRQSIRDNFINTVLDGWSSDEEDDHDKLLSGEERLTIELVYLAYGLNSSARTASDKHKRCDNKWLDQGTGRGSPCVAHQRDPSANGRASSTSRSTTRTPTPQATTSKPRQQMQQECITLDSDGDEIINNSDDDATFAPSSSTTKSKPTSSKMKSKGKARDSLECCSDNCNGDPQCLNWLGQEQWETRVKAFKSFSKAHGLANRNDNDREEGVPVGLKNLGATCYANSFLQVWFRDLPFRQGVYSCLPPADGAVDASPLFQLQVLFAFLQRSNQAVYDPEPFVTSLRLDKGEQQDAQEFSKLFMSLLDHEFKKQATQAQAQGNEAAKKVGQLMSDQFEGKITYGTKCDVCNNRSERTSTFLELEINLKNRTTLEDRIRTSLGDETLSGDNQYYCDKCEVKGNALRYMRLDAIPPVLHLSLLRFVFSMKDMSRQKSQAMISYPLELDMGQFLPLDIGGNKPQVWYDLKGVLMHKGKSAYHGHYVAQVHDELDKKWYLFDDESVTPIDDLNGPDLYDEEGERITSSKQESNSSTTKKKLASGFKIAPNGSIMPQSQDAYMLIYTRRSDRDNRQADDAQVHSIVEPAPPPLATMRVAQLDEKYQQEQDAYARERSKMKVLFEQIREQKRSVYRVWDQFNDDDEGALVSKAQLKRWLEDGLVASSKGEDKSEVVDAEEDKSKHQSSADQAKTNQSDSSGDVVMKDSGLKTAPEVVPENATVVAAKAIADANADAKTTQAEPVAQLANGHAVQMASDDKTGTIGLSVMAIDNTAIMCKHDKVDPIKAEQVKRISTAGIEAFRQLGIQTKPDCRVPDSLCRTCAFSLVGDPMYFKRHERKLKDFIKVSKHSDGDDVRYYISSAWLKDWQKSTPSLVHTKRSICDILPDEEGLFDEDVVCEHGNLSGPGPGGKSKWTLISQEAVDVLKTVVPKWNPVIEGSIQPCDQCKQANDAQAKVETETKGAIQTAKRTYKSLLSQVGQGTLTIGYVFSGTGAHYIVPKTWAKQLHNWTKPKMKSGPRPPDLDNKSLLCKHEKLAIDLEHGAVEVEGGAPVLMVPKEEWSALEKEFNAAPAIRALEGERGQYISKPVMCRECIEENRKNFMETRLRVRMLTDDDFDKDGERKLFDAVEEVPQAGSSRTPGSVFAPPRKPPPLTFSQKPPTVTYGSRQSSRLSSRTLFKTKHDSFLIDISKNDTIKDIRMRIYEDRNIPTICQRLFYNFQELDSDQTVSELHLDSDAVLELYQVEEDDAALDKLDDVDPGAFHQQRSGKKGKASSKRKRDEGFGGTGLYGWDRQAELDGTGEDDPVEDPDADASTSNGPSGPTKLRKREGSDVSAAKLSVPSSSSAGLATAHSGQDDFDELHMGDATIACPHCTFLNSALLKECEMCGGALPEQ
ncbi:hypothetical protein OIO90_000173 [Microbotryomycetes sp. JL221]|nr:hypothetical protein OIO90_000173 [Microbotryomycetes sp. JL221]